MSFDAGAPGSAQTNATFKLYNAPYTVIGHGTVGYQRFFNSANPPVEQNGGYFYIVINDWNVTGLTGDQYIQADYNQSLLYHVSIVNGYNGVDPVTAGNMVIAATAGITASPTGQYTINYQSGTYADYTANKPGGLLINGSVNKTNGGTRYSSQAFIFHPNGTTIASENLLNSNDYSFNIPFQQIMIGIKGANGQFYNSTTLFNIGPGYPTPTPTPVPGTTIPAGYIRTTLNVWDRSGAMVHGANIQIKDIEAGVWSNSTSDADGIHTIDTLPGHTVSMYADFSIFSNELLPGSLLSQEAGHNYFLTLFPYESGAPAGNVSLYVEVKDTMGSFIPYANVQILLPNGYSYSGSTANAGSKVFLVPNNTIIKATGTASGYLPATAMANSGTSGGTTTMTITLTRQVVTTAPTSTVPPGGVTPAVTFDARSINQKDEDMMGQIRDAGPDLISLAIAVTMISLLGLMMKGFK
jgi:hypothetical protein